MRRREVFGLAAAAALAQEKSAVTKFVRFRQGGSGPRLGILEGDTIRPIEGPLYGAHQPSGEPVKLGSVKLLFPATPRKVFAVGRNYKSHIGNVAPPSRPEIFYKPLTCLQHPGDPILIPSDAKNVHYEGELVLVMGKRGKNLKGAQAREAIFGVTCGNDVSERDWQGGADKDMQWWRAKGADTFGPLGPAIVRGLDDTNLQLTTRLNGKVVQQQRTSDLIYNAVAIIEWISRYVTIEPGDLIFTGTPGTTAAMKPGDIVEVEIEGIGVLRNPVEAAKPPR
jgi:2-keto-4-pentenoate hydratase/2-oxohepta-3-ene-1,7-dioic acid hydratase in catechol pathway